MFLSRILLEGSSPRFLVSTRGVLPRSRISHRPLRWKSTTIVPPQPVTPRKKYVFPERLIVYHAGTGRSVFLGCLKLTTIFMFSFFSLVVAPAHWYGEENQKLVAAGIVLSGIIPMVFVGYISSPFVAHIHLRLPSYARRSRDIMYRYTKNLPKDAEIEVTTMNFIGKPRLSLVRVGDLVPSQKRFGMVSYVRDTKKIDSKRRWYMGKAVKQFGMYGGVPIKSTPGVWEDIARSLKRN